MSKQRTVAVNWLVMGQGWGRPAAMLVAGVLVLLVGTTAMAQTVARFDVWEYQVEGNSLLDDGPIEQAVSPFLGEGRAIADVDGARAALMKRYHDAGYLSVQVLIPEQKIDGGVVRLQVVEAPLSEVKVLGARYRLPSRLRGEVSALTPGQVPNFNDLQQQLAEVNRSADVKVSPVLKAGSAPGTVAAQIEVEDQPAFHGSLEINSRQSMNTAPTRLSASVRYDDLFQRGHTLGFSATATPSDLAQVRSFSLNYGVPSGLGGEGVNVYLAQSRSRLNVTVSELGMGVVGNTDIVGLRYNWPLPSPSGWLQTLTAGLDLKHIRGQRETLGQTTDEVPVRYAPASLNYRVVFLRHQPQPSSLDIGLVAGMRGLLGNSDERFDRKREGSSASFLALKPSFQYSESLLKWTASARVDMQWASGPLLASEQYSAGGADTVRGYYEGERAADQALRVSLELASPWQRLEAGRSELRWQGLLFLDQARLQTLQPAAGQLKVARLGSAGLGMRVSGLQGMQLSVDAARALRDGDVASGGTRQGEWRAHVRLQYEF